MSRSEMNCQAFRQKMDLFRKRWIFSAKARLERMLRHKPSSSAFPYIQHERAQHFGVHVWWSSPQISTTDSFPAKDGSFRQKINLFGKSSMDLFRGHAPRNGSRQFFFFLFFRVIRVCSLQRVIIFVYASAVWEAIRCYSLTIHFASRHVIASLHLFLSS